jgi:hypothetical protein
LGIATAAVIVAFCSFRDVKRSQGICASAMVQEANISNDVHRIFVTMGNPPNCLIVRISYRRVVTVKLAVRPTHALTRTSTAGECRSQAGMGWRTSFNGGAPIQNFAREPHPPAGSRR